MLSSNISDIKKIISEYPVNKLIFWTGAGIDVASPTCLPLGKELTTEILNQACGKDITENLMEQWRLSSQNIKNITGNDISISDIPRLETILEGIRIFENNVKTECSVLKGLESFKDAPPNDSHFILAYLLHNGANIITTNYDSCVAKAYNILYQGKYSLRLIDSDGSYMYISSHTNAGKIYYIHGISQHIKNIGATLSIVKNPITNTFSKQMDEWISNDSCFVYIGYSGWDSLDVNPYFRNRNRSNVSTGIYVRHSSNIDETKIIHSKQNENELISCFHKQYICLYNTNQMLKAIFHIEFKIESAEYNWLLNYKFYSNPYNDIFKKICSLSILYLLNLNPNAVIGDNWSDEYLNYFHKDIDNWFLGYYGFQNCIRCNEKAKAKQYYSKLDRSVLLKADIRATHAKYIHLIKTWFLLGNIENKLKAKIKTLEPIEWEISTPINQLTKGLLVFMSKYPAHFNIVKNIYRNKLDQLIRMLKAIIKAGTLYVVEINQINVAYANLGLLELIVNQNMEKSKYYIELSKRNYIEVNSISGIINTMLYEVIYNVMSYIFTKETIYKENAIKFYLNVNRIIESEGYTGEKEKLVSVITKIGVQAGINLKI